MLWFYLWLSIVGRTISNLPPKSGKPRRTNNVSKNNRQGNASFLSKPSEKAPKPKILRPLSGVSAKRQPNGDLPSSRGGIYPIIYTDLEPEMYHYKDYKEINNKILNLPSFKEILTSIDSNNMMSKNSRSNKSFSLMSDLNKKREYMGKRNAQNKFSSNRRSIVKANVALKGKAILT